MLLEDQLHAWGINLHILTGIRAGPHRPDGNMIADRMLFMAAEMERERDLIREQSLDGLRAAQAEGRRGSRPAPSTMSCWPSLALARTGRAAGPTLR